LIYQDREAKRKVHGEKGYYGRWEVVSLERTMNTFFLPLTRCCDLLQGFMYIPCHTQEEIYTSGTGDCILLFAIPEGIQGSFQFPSLRVH